MDVVIYEIPNDIHELFKDVKENDGYISYRIINYNEGMDMDNFQSMKHFIECVDISYNSIIINSGTQIILKHPDYHKNVVVDSGGLGDFFSHSFECRWDINCFISKYNNL